jgi:hypothetical protein
VQRVYNDVLELDAQKENSDKVRRGEVVLMMSRVSFPNKFALVSRIDSLPTFVPWTTLASLKVSKLHLHLG